MTPVRIEHGGRFHSIRIRGTETPQRALSALAESYIATLASMIGGLYDAGFDIGFIMADIAAAVSGGKVIAATRTVETAEQAEKLQALVAAADLGAPDKPQTN